MRGADTRELIVSVSARLFEERGIAGTTMRAIADRCAIKAASLYNHFASKDEIVAEVLARSGAFAGERYAEVSDADLGPLDRVEALMRATVASFRRHPEASRIFSENADYVASAPLLKRVRATAHEIDELWTHAIRDAMRIGAIRDDIEPDDLWSLLREMMLAASRGADEPRADAIVAVLLRGVVR